MQPAGAQNIPGDECPPGTGDLLKVWNLRISLENHGRISHLVEDVSFHIRPGKALGIVGESGSGKTLSALAIMQLLPDGLKVSDGNIWFFLPEGETDLLALGEKEMRSVRGRYISMIFQEPMTSLNPSMQVGEQIREAAMSHSRSEKSTANDQAMALLEEVRLPSGREFTAKYPHQLSGGQRQRVMIAMALAGDPSLLIADEPTTALDVTVQKKILELLARIREQRKMSMLFISHDLGVIKNICEEALVMYQGRLVEKGPVTKLFKNPSHPYTKGLISCRPDMRTHPDRLKTIHDYDQDDPSDKGRTTGGMVSRRNRYTDHNDGTLLSVRNLEVNYALKKSLFGRVASYKRAVDRFSFDILTGETLGLIGESGSGKSTLGKSLIRLLQSGKGEITYRGENVAALKGKDLKEFRQKVQFIFQDPYSSLNPRIRAGKAIDEVLRVHRKDLSADGRKAAVLKLLDRVGLQPEHFDRYPHEFSGGQRQRIGIARALATDPELMICDESVSSLDVSVQAVILNLLNDLKEEYNLTYLFISHDLAVVRYMSDRILVMQEGKLVEQGSGEQIFKDPSSDYTRELIDSVPD